MFRATIRTTEETDVPTTVMALRAQAERAGVSAGEVETLTSEVAATLVDLVDRGRNMISAGSQMNVTRTFKHEDFEVKLVFVVGISPSFVERLARVLWQR